MYLMLSRNAVRLCPKFKQAPFRGIERVTVRNLFTKEELGVMSFERIRQEASDNLSAEAIENVKTNLLESFNDKTVYQQRDDLKLFIFLINGSDDEFNVLKSCLVSYNHSYHTIVHSVKEFVFGTQIMRLLYLLNLPDKAVEFFKDPDLRTVFEQMQTYKVLLSLLYENKRYEEVFQIYKDIRKHIDIYELFPDITINCLAFGACYKLNTPSHFTYAKNLWNDTQNTKQLNRSRFFLADLALKQNQPRLALALVRFPEAYVTVRYIRLKAYTQLGEFDNAMDILNRSIETFKLKIVSNKPCYGKQMVDDLRQAIEKSGRRGQLIEFNRIHLELTSLDLLNNDTLDERLCATFPPMLPKNVYLKMKKKTSKQ